MIEPKVTVLMSVYNAEEFLSKSIESILNQTFTEFEFLIINDGSTDRTSKILQNYHDPRMKIIDNQKNIGLTKSLNKGLEIARCEYIARQDADDISLPCRLEKQVKYMDSHPKIGILGTWVEIIDGKNKILKTCREPTQPIDISWKLIFKNCLSHSSIMYRKKIVCDIGKYKEDTMHAQDYDLWSTLNIKNIEFAQIPEILVQWRMQPNNISNIYDEKQEYTVRDVIRKNVSQFLGIQIRLDLATAFCNLTKSVPLEDGNLVGEITDLIQRLQKKFVENRNLTKEESLKINRNVLKRLLSLARVNAGYFPYASLSTLYQTLFINLRVVFMNEFWISILKAILGYVLIDKIKKVTKRFFISY